MKRSAVFLFIVCMSFGCDSFISKKANQESSFPAGRIISGGSGAQDIYSGRRSILSDSIGNGIIMIRSDYGFSGGRHEYRAAGNFYYLSGLSLTGSILAIEIAGNRKYTLFITEKSIREAAYTGDIPGPGEIMKTYLADTVMTLPESDLLIEKSLLAGMPLYIDFADTAFRSFILGMARRLNADINLIRDVAAVVNENRVKKDFSETNLIQKAVDITGEAFINACRICQPGMKEYEIEAMIEYTFRKNGSSMPAFESIVASGKNAVVLHYSDNSAGMENGDLLLMDIGAEYEYYCADITRTIPVNGIFSKEQREIYDLILESQKAAISEMIAGKPIVAGHNKSTAIIIDGLYKLGLITDTTSTWQKKFYFIYPISHYLGLNVHDVGDYGASYEELRANLVNDTLFGRKLEEGMVLTVEPGLYFRENGLDQLHILYGHEASTEEIDEFIAKVAPVYEKYKNIGIRIEDDVLITAGGNRVLSALIPKEPNEIEQLMQKKNRLVVDF